MDMSESTACASTAATDVHNLGRAVAVLAGTHCGTASLWLQAALESSQLPTLLRMQRNATEAALPLLEPRVMMRGVRGGVEADMKGECACRE